MKTLGGVLRGSTLTAVIDGAGTLAKPGQGYAGRVTMLNVGSNTIGKFTAYNNNVTDLSTIILSVERNATSANTVYAANVARDNTRASWCPATGRNVNGQLRSFDVDIRIVAGGNMGTSTGCIVHYMIIN